MKAFGAVLIAATVVAFAAATRKRAASGGSRIREILPEQTYLVR